MKNDQRGVAPVVILVAVLVAVAVFAGGYLLWTRQGGAGLSDADRLDQGFSKTMEETSVDADGQVSVKGGDAGEDPSMDVTATVNLAGIPLPANTVEHPSMQGSFSVTGTSEGKPVSGTMEMRSIPPKTFLRLGSLSLPDMGEAGTIIQAALNTWVYFEAGDKSEMSEMMEDLSPVTLPSNCEPTDAQKAAVKDYVESLTLTDFVTDIQNMGPYEMPGGDEDRTATRLAMTPDVDAIKAVGAQVQTLSGCETSSNDDDSTAINVTRLQVLVGDQTGLIRGVDATVHTSDQDKDVDVVASFRLGNYGEAPTVEEPAGAVTTDQLMQQIMTQMMGSGMHP